MILVFSLFFQIAWFSQQFVEIQHNGNTEYSNFQNILPVEDLFARSDKQFQRCAVVSTSGSLLGSTDASKIIDAADTVFRVNFAPTTSFDQFVGRATDVVVADALLANYSDIDTTALRRASAERHGDPLIIIHSPESAAEFASMQKRIETVLSVRALALSRSFEQMAASLVSTEAQVLRLTVPCMAAAVDRDLCRPSSSLVAALLAIARCRESVTLFGFANPRMHSASLYYYDAPQLISNSNVQEGFQEFRIENQILSKLITQRPLEIFTNWLQDALGTKTVVKSISFHSAAPKKQNGITLEPGEAPFLAFPTHAPTPSPLDKFEAKLKTVMQDDDNNNDELLDESAVQDNLAIVSQIQAFERQMNKKFGIAISDLKRLEKINAEISSTYTVTPNATDTADDMPPISHANRIPIPVVPSDLVDAAERAAAQALRDAGDDPVLQAAATLDVRKYKLPYTRNAYVKSTKLGAGTYGTAYLCTPEHNNTYKPEIKSQFIDGNRKLVIKVLKSGHKSSLMMREVLILERLRGVPYALQMIDVVHVGKSHTGLVFPFTNNSYYRGVFPLLSATDVRDYWRKVLTALSGAHERGIVHMDIKPINIFYDYNTRELQLGDWGLGFFYNNQSKQSWQTMTVYWKAPEVFFGAKDYSYAVDMWSIGVCFAGMVTGKYHFFDGVGMYQIARSWIEFLGTDEFEAFVRKYEFVIDPHWLRVFVPRRIAPVSWLSLIKNENRHLITAEALDLASKMLRFDPAQRISARDALKHPYFSKYQTTHLEKDELLQLAQTPREKVPDGYLAWDQKKKHKK